MRLPVMDKEMIFVFMLFAIWVYILKYLYNYDAISIIIGFYSALGSFFLYRFLRRRAKNV